MYCWPPSHSWYLAVLLIHKRQEFGETIDFVSLSPTLLCKYEVKEMHCVRGKRVSSRDRKQGVQEESSEIAQREFVLWEHCLKKT